MEFLKRLFGKKQEKRSISYETGISCGLVPLSRTCTAESALALSSVWCAVRVLAEGIASLPLITYQRTPKGKERATTHPLYNLLRTEPNPESTAYTFWETMVLHWAVFGNAYAEIIRDGSGRPQEMFPLDARCMTPERTKSGKLQYQYRDGGGSATLAAEDVLHIPGLSLDGITGMNILRVAANALTLTDAAEEYGRSFFANCARPSGFLQHPAAMSDQAQQNLKRSWDAMYSGSGNTGKTVVLEEGMTYNPVSLTNEEGQFVETRQFQILEVCRFFNIPPHKIKALDRATWGNIESENISWVTDSLRPICTRFEQEGTRKLLMPDEKDNYFVEFLLDGLLRGDTATRYGVYQTALTNRIMSVNEVRAMENMNAVDDPAFDVPGIPGDDQPDDDQGDDQQPAEEQPAEAEEQA